MAALCGSCSGASQAQVALHAESHPVHRLVVSEIMSGAAQVDAVADWVMAQTDGIPLVASSDTPEAVVAAQDAFGAAAVSERLEGFFAALAAALVARGVRRLIVAGGETSGAAVRGLALEAFAFGPEIDPGVPALRSADGLCLALKSGNFGAPDFFAKAARVLAGAA